MDFGIADQADIAETCMCCTWEEKRVRDQGFLSAGTGPHGSQLPQQIWLTHQNQTLKKAAAEVKSISSLICNADCKKPVPSKKQPILSLFGHLFQEQIGNMNY